MKTHDLSAAIPAFVCSLVTLASFVSRNPATPQKETNRVKAQRLGDGSIRNRSQAGWRTTSAGRVHCLLRYLLWTSEPLRLRNTRTQLVALAISLCMVAQAFGQTVITIQPQDQSVSVGGSVEFSVFANGAKPLSYQWRRNETALAGATNVSLMLSNLQVADAGSYTVIITDAFADATTSEAALLVVDATFTKITVGPIVTDLHASFATAWGDYNNDGFIDLIVGEYEGPTSLYRNNGDGSFTKITSGVLVTDPRDTAAAFWGDYDNDGILDVYVPSINTFKNALYHNDGTGSFTRVLTGPVVEDPTGNGHSNGACWGDYNADGYLDLLVANSGLPNALYRNKGNETFDKVSASEAGPIVSYSGRSLLASWADYDGDGDLDALIPVLGQTNNLFYRNNGNDSFTQLFRPDIGDLDEIQTAPGGPSWFDYDNDGDLDVFIPDGGFSEFRNDAFYRNDGGRFTKLTEAQIGPIVADNKTGLSSAAADYDNDGYADLFVTVPGRLSGDETGDDNLLYHNNGDGTFSRVTTGSLVQDRGASYGCAWGDYNNDGFMDLVVVNGIFVAYQKNFLYQNNGNTNHWLKVKLTGTTSNRGAVGAKVRIKAAIGGRTFWQLRIAGDSDGYSSQQDPRLNFGLGDASVAETVRIEWPSGIVQELPNVAANQILNVIEPVRLQATGRGAFEFRSWKGQVFGVQASPDLLVWSSLRSVTNTTGVVQFSDQEAPSVTARFYRVLPQ